MCICNDFQAWRRREEALQDLVQGVVPSPLLHKNLRQHMADAADHTFVCL